MQEVLKKVQYVDICNYHNQTIDFFNEIKKYKNYFPKKLINFDMHSDIRCNIEEEFVCVYNWVFFAFEKFGITDYYWVFPKSVFENKEFLAHIFESISNISKKRAFYGNFTKKDYEYSTELPLIQRFVLDVKNRIFKTEFASLDKDDFLKKVSDNENYKPLNVYICTEDNLPDFKDEDIIVSVDGDYFANNGYDTYNDYSYNSENIEKQFESFINCLKEKNINPLYLSLCVSTNYSLQIDKINQFYEEIKENCVNSEKLDFVYKHTDTRCDEYDYVVLFFHKKSDEFELFDVPNNGRKIDKNIGLEFVKQYCQDLTDGTYLFSFYIKDCVNEDTGEAYLKMYSDEQIIDVFNY